MTEEHATFTRGPEPFGPYSPHNCFRRGVSVQIRSGEFAMPFRSMSTLQSWLDEFEELGYPIAGSAKVIPQDGDEGADTGLVVFQLSNAPTLAYLQPEMSALEWRVTMEAREAPATMNPATVLSLAYELSVISALGAFLQSKSRAYMDHNKV